MKQGYKQINDRDAKIIVVFGLPGSGKSTFAQKLASAMDAHLISSDTVRNELLLRGDYAEATKEKVYAQMLKMAIAAIKRGYHVILDGTYYKDSLRRKITYRVRELHLIPHFIEVKADEEIIRGRINAKRKESDADYAVYLKIREQFEPMCDYHLVVHSDTQEPAEMLTKAMLFIGIYHETA